jgi:hypothetical protein
MLDFTILFAFLPRENIPPILEKLSIHGVEQAFQGPPASPGAPSKRGFRVLGWKPDFG